MVDIHSCVKCSIINCFIRLLAQFHYNLKELKEEKNKINTCIQSARFLGLYNFVGDWLYTTGTQI